MLAIGRFQLHEPGTAMIGAFTVLLSGLVAAVPELAVTVGPGTQPHWAPAVLQAQSAALGIVGWLAVAWALAAVALHAYNRWLLAELVRRSGGNSDQ